MLYVLDIIDYTMIVFLIEEKETFYERTTDPG